MRLTKEEIEMLSSSRFKAHEIITLMQKELIEYKDIEEEFGIDLIILVKALKNGIYDKQGKHYYPHLEYIDDGQHKEFVLIDEQGDYRPDFWFRFKYYGETWALTKEELEK